MANIQFDLTEIFTGERIGYLSTIDNETGAPQVNVLSWIYGYKANVLRIAVTSKSKLVSNIESNDHINFSFFYEKSIVSAQCKGKIITKNLPGVPFPLTLIELVINELYDIMFYGAEITQEPMYQKTNNSKAAKKLDEQVHQGMVANYEEELVR